VEKVYIVAACRTAIGSFGGTLKDIPAVRLGEIAVRGALEQTDIPARCVDEVILGNVLQAGLGQNTARQVAVHAGIPVEVPAYTINKVCGSGLKAVSLGAQSVALGETDCVITGGMESMSRAPYTLEDLRWGGRMGNREAVDEMIRDGLWDVFNNYHMGITAEKVAEKYGVSRRDQDDFALRSQLKAAQAQREGRYSDEIVPVTIPQRKGELIRFTEDEYIRPDVTSEKLAALMPAFKKDGTVTAGNASGINDGAACIILASEEFVKEHGLKPFAVVAGTGSAGVDPAVMGIAPVPSAGKAVASARISLDKIDLFEINEAFAAQSVAVIRELGLDINKVNVNGGAIALGHPIGASGARILVTLLHEMIRRNLEYGLATLCIGGGMGEALVVRRDQLCL